MPRLPHCVRAFTLSAVALAGACSSSAEGDTGTSRIELGTLPYNPLVHHLDLSTLAYQVHGQSLVWPFDPFYEERADPLGSSRDDYMANVRAFALSLPNSSELDSYRGPGIGFEQNSSHDPVLYDYSRIHPWSSCVFNAAGEWTEYLTPDPIVRRINQVFVAYSFRPTGSATTEVRLVQMDPQITPGDRDPDARDVLFAFEGGTGDKGEPNQPASQSLMGVVLLRSTGADSYDVHIAFRGSRSGTAVRAFFEALSTNDASGNPDWITDLGFADAPEPTRSAVTTVGNVCRGFSTSMLSILPQLSECLQKIVTLRSEKPTNIYVTGHSLGGALAQHFAGAVLLGNRFGPDGAGPEMPATLRQWPWRNLKLITYGAPRAGDEAWARELTNRLQSVYDDSGSLLPDPDALKSTESAIVERLIDPTRPAAFRVLISTDPITSAIPGDDGEHVGQTVYVNKTNNPLSVFGTPDPDDHEPINIRSKIVEAIRDSRTPAVAWRYRPLSDLPPARGDSERGTTAGFQKLRDAVINYYNSRGLWFDQNRFLADFQLLLTLEN